MSNSRKLGGMVLIISIMVSMLMVGCGKGSHGGASKSSMSDEQLYGYVKAKLNTASASEEVGLVQSYLSAYPNGKHMGDATALLEQAKQANAQRMINECINNLRKIDGAKEQVAMAKKKVDASKVTAAEVNEYISGNTTPVCPCGGTYSYNNIGSNPTCTIKGHTLGQF